jgi:predicted nucleotidyltransferase
MFMYAWKNHCNQNPIGRERSLQELIRAIARVVARVVARESDPDAIILFGPHATGTARPYSDIHILVVKPQPFGPGNDRRQKMTRLWRVLARFPVPKDIVVFGRQEVERYFENGPHGTAVHPAWRRHCRHGGLFRNSCSGIA